MTRDHVIAGALAVALAVAVTAVRFAEANERINRALASIRRADPAPSPPVDQRTPPASEGVPMPLTDTTKPGTASLAAVMAAIVGPDAAHIAAAEFALTEAADGHVDCAREALRGLPDGHLRRAITGAALLSSLAAGILSDRGTPNASRPADPQS